MPCFQELLRTFQKTPLKDKDIATDTLQHGTHGCILTDINTAADHSGVSVINQYLRPLWGPASTGMRRNMENTPNKTEN